ncbi:MAG: shikimate kinase [Planktomarina sp.]
MTTQTALKTSLVLVGMMGSGKSAVGKALAAELDMPFVDADTEIEIAANMSIKEIFARDGEAFFRQAEARVINRLLTDGVQVLATGGGAFMSPVVREALKDGAITVFLDATIDTLWERVRYSKTRPLLQTEDPLRTLTALLANRRPTYLTADLIVKTRVEYSIGETMAVVIDALAKADYLKVSV